jgi:hypothetical protein
MTIEVGLLKLAAFADGMRVDAGGACSATGEGRRFPLRVAVGLDAGTVDLLRAVAPGVEGGAHLRVAPRPGGGGAVDMTVPVAVDDDPAVAADTVRTELAALAHVLASDPR